VPYDGNTIEEYIKAIPDERRSIIQNLRALIHENLPMILKNVSYLV